MVRKRIFGYAARIAGAIAAAVPLLMISCDLASLDAFDAFPPYLQRAEASIDLGGILTNAGFGDDVQIVRLEQVTSPTDGTSFVLVALNEEGTQRLLVLRGSDLSFVRMEENTGFDEFLGGDVQGRFLCGRVAFASGIAALTTDPDLDAAISSFDQHWRLASIGKNDFNAMFGAFNSDVRLLDYTTASSWSTVFPINDFSKAIANPASNYTFLDVFRETGSSDSVRVLFDRDGRLVIATFDTYADMRNAIDPATITAAKPYFTSWASLISGPFTNGENSWLTRDGVVVAKGNRKELVFYPFSNIQKEYPLSIGQNFEESFISVDPMGDRWFFYDSESNWLYALRTWW